MSSPFENFRVQLRQAGCEVLTDNQWKGVNGYVCNLLQIIPRNHDRAVRCMVIDMKAEGYRLFIENDALKIEDDVDAVIENQLSQTVA